MWLRTFRHLAREGFRRKPFPVRLGTRGGMLAILALMLHQFALPVALPATLPALRDASGVQGNAVTFTVTRSKIESFQPDRVDLSVDLVATPAVAATLSGVRFLGARIEGQTPVYLKPIDGEFVLKPGAPLALPAIHASIFYADFPSPSRMQAILSARSFHLSGEIRAALRLTFFEKLAVRDLHPVAVLTLDQDVPLENDAVDGQTKLEVGLFAMAQKVLSGSASILDRVAGVRIATDNGAATDGDARSTVIIRTTYRITQGGRPIEKSCTRLGFWIEPQQVATTAEALDPWLYSAEVAGLLASGATLDKASVETVVKPAAERTDAPGATSGWNLRHGDFSVARHGNAGRVKLVLSAGNTVSILDSGSPGNFAVLQFRDAAVLQFRDAKEERVTPGTAGQTGAPAHILRWWRQDGMPQLQQLQVDPLPAGGLSRPVDESAFGSPVLSGGGVVGMVIGEEATLPLSSLIKH